ncbi:MAG: glycoside hydrolase family 3 N-terminal domain-containing protein [Bacteroidota bacterium]
MNKKYFFLLFYLLLFFCFQSNAQRKNLPPYKDNRNDITTRVNDLLGRMTLEEKMAQIVCIWNQKNELILDQNGNFDPVKASKNLPYGIGQIGRPSEAMDRNAQNRSARNMAIFTNTMQRHFIENTRLGIPVIFHEECLHGHAAKDGTSFPQPIALASTWDTELIENIFSLVAEEARSRGAHQALSPVVDVARDARWGRFEETFGEDPYLVSQMGIAAVKGFQGKGPEINDKHMLATLKHMTGHGQPESGTNTAPANISERELREIFFPPFKKAVTEGNVHSVMASYNEIDGVPSHANQWLLQEVLRKEWGFKGYVVSDYGAISDLYRLHHVAEGSKEAAKLAIKAGVDIELPDMVDYPVLSNSFKSGELPMALLDSAVARQLYAKFLLGIFDKPYVNADYAERFVGSEKNGKLALEAAQESITLLKNDYNLLPLNADDYKTIAVIGPNANKTLLGGYSDVPPYFVTALKGIENYLQGEDISVVYGEGCRITEEGSWYLDPVVLPDPQEDLKRIKHAVTLAERSDIVILVVGGNELTSREAWSETHMGDRASLQLFGNQEKLFNELLKTGKQIITVLFNGRPLQIDFLADNTHALLECWYLGQESGSALANVLFGEVNPSGKLPCTIPRSVGHLPAFYNHKPTARRGYLFGDISPLFPFGYGLSYTNFRYSGLTLTKNTIAKNETTTVEVDITNTGDLRGDEIVQLYIRDRVSSVTRPVKELKAFQKVNLRPGQVKKVSFKITPEMLKFWDINMEYVVEPGVFELMIGTSSVEYESVELTVTE